MAISPWSVKGVEPETREAAKVAARRAGLPLGAWLTQVIRSAAVQQFKGPPPATPSFAAPEIGDGADSATSGGTTLPAPTLPAVFESIQRLAARLDEAETRAGEAVAPLAQRLEALSSTLDEVKARPAVVIAPVERAMMRIAERLDRIEGGRDKAKPARRGPFGLW
jgi:localization factor PodJL